MVRVIVLTVLLVSALVSQGCGVRGRQPSVAAVPPAPAAVRPDFDQILAAFGDMVTAYCVNNDQPTIIDIDIIPNISPDKLPVDIGGYCRRAIEAMGPFMTTRSVGGLDIFKGPGPVLVEREKPKGASARYKIVGSLEGALPVREVDDNGQIAGTGGKGRWQGDGIWGSQKHITRTNVTVTFTLEDYSNGVAVPGTTVRCRIVTERLERNWSLGVYLGGSGINKDRRISQTDDLTDALYSVTSAAMVHLLSNALVIPAYRLSPVFRADQEKLSERLHDRLTRFTREGVEEYVKRFMFVKGEQMDLKTASLTDADRAKIIEAMAPNSYSDRAALISFAARLWRETDFATGAKKVRQRLAETANAIAQRQHDAEVAAAALRQAGKSPREFGWPESAAVVVLDLSLVEVKARENVLAVARHCSGCQEMKTLDPDNTIVGIRLSGSPIPVPNEVQHVLRLSSLPLQFIWTVPDQRLVVKFE